MRKVCVVVTARPSYSRIKSALAAIRDNSDLTLQLVVGASALLSRFGNTVHQIKADGFTVDAEVFSILDGENPTTTAKSTGLGVIELSSVFAGLRPDVVVTVADRFETLATAIAASYMNLPLAHIQGGEVSGSIDEKVRHAVTKLADLHCVANDVCRERVIRMGEAPDAVFATGCPSIDLAAEIRHAPGPDFDPFERYGGVGATFDPDNGYLVVLQHPVTTEFGSARAQINETFEAVQAIGLPTFWFWPNVDPGSDELAKAIRVFREHQRDETQIRFFRSMAPEDFLKLMVGCKCIVGNSSAGIREGSFLGTPCVNIGTRQQGRQRGPNVIDVSYDRVQISQGIERHLAQGKQAGVPLYGDGRAGIRIGCLLSDVELRTDKSLTY